MSKERAPAFQFYPRDFIADGDQAALTLEQVGAYTRLMCYAWLKGGLDDDIAKLARMICAPEDTVALVLREHFERHERAGVARWVNPRQEEERRKQSKHRKQQRLAGLASANGRANARSTTVPTEGQREGNSSSASSSSSSSASTSVKHKQKTEVQSTAVSVPDRFEDFYALYPPSPNNPGPFHARNAWKKLKPETDVQTMIIEAIRRQREWPQMTKEGGRFVCTPQKWLSEHRWLAPDPPLETYSSPASSKTAGNAAAGREALALVQGMTR